jgi:hypothetical protein
MKRRITLSIALTLSVVLVSLMSSDQAAKAQQGRRIAGDTGIITLGPSQVLRITVNSDEDGDSDGADFLVFRRIEYSQGACGGGGVCKLAVASQTTSNPIALMPGEAALYDISEGASNTVGVRGVALSNRRNVRVTGIVFDTATWRVVTFVNVTPGNTAR